MKTKLRDVVLAAVACAVSFSPAALAQGAPPAGYFDIPAGHDFPADKARLEQIRDSGDFAAQRRHVWDVFAGLTEATPDGRFAVWETWYSDKETFRPGATAEAAGPHPVVRPFRLPSQSRSAPHAPVPPSFGTSVLSFVVYNFAAYTHIRSNALYSPGVLETLQQIAAPDPTIADNRTIPPFPPAAVAMKTLWWPVAQDHLTPLPVWDREANPPRPDGNPFPTWARVVAVDPRQMDASADATTDISFLGRTFAGAHVVGLNDFHFVTLDEQAVRAAMENSGLALAARQIIGRDLRAGDHVVFIGADLTTKETDDWVWATFWWHDRPDSGPFAADRPAAVKGRWRNYLMQTSYDVTLPREPDGSPHIAYNPWLETRFADGTVSNCMTCHRRASWPVTRFLPISRGDPDLKRDPAFASGQLRTDFLWSIP